MPPLSDATLAYGEDMVKALLGADALYRSLTPSAGDDDRLVVVNMAPSYAPASFATVDAFEARFDELHRRAAALPEPDRRTYYDQLCVSTLALLRWRTAGLSFSDQLHSFLHVPAAPPADDELDRLRVDIRALLTGMGYDGDLAAQCAAWQERMRVPADDVAAVLTDLMSEAWTRTEEILALPAPRADGMRVATVRDVAFNARCDYLHRTVELNIDPVLTRPALKHLAVHEGYPGHYVQFKLRETWHHEGTAAADGLLSIVNSASSCTFEGIADNGMRVIDWLDTDDDRAQALLTRYNAGIGAAAAWRLHALGWNEGQARDWLHAQGLTGGEGWVDNRLRFIMAPQRSVLIWSYWWGDAAVGPAWERAAPAHRDDFLRFLYGRMHSVNSVAMFAV